MPRLPFVAKWASTSTGSSRASPACGNKFDQRGLRGIHAKASPLAQVIGRVVGHPFASRTGVGRHHNHAANRAAWACAPDFGDEVLLGASQPRQPTTPQGGADPGSPLPGRKTPNRISQFSTSERCLQTS